MRNCPQCGCLNEHSHMRPSPGLFLTSQNSFGREQLILSGAQPEEMARIQLDRNSIWTVSIEAIEIVNFNPGDGVPLAPFAVLKWGNGNTLFLKTIQPIFHIDVPVLASTVSVSAYIGDAVTQQPAGNGTSSCKFKVSIAEGTLGLPQRNSFFVNAHNVIRTFVASGQQRLFSVRGYNYQNTQRWLMGFDTTAPPFPPNGTVPDVAVPIPPVGGSFSDSWINTHPFRLGLVWCVSSTPDVLTQDFGAAVRIETELALL